MTHDIIVDEVIEAEELASESKQGSLLESTEIVTGGRVARRPPIFIDNKAVEEHLKRRLKVIFSQQYVNFVSSHLLLLENAILFGQGGVIIPKGGRYRLIKNSVREFLVRSLAPPGMERHEDGTFKLQQPVQRTVQQRCLLLQRPWSNNFGHWLVDQAMALSYLNHQGVLPTNDIVVAKVASSKLRCIMMETISAILPTAVIHEHPDSEAWICKELAYITPLHVPPLFKLPAALDCLRRDLLRGVSQERQRWPRFIYILRPGNSRKLVNENEILGLCAEHGFQVVSPENLSMLDQAALFGEADAVIGVKGAAMANILFCKPNTPVMLMSPGSFIDPFFWDIASTRHLAYSEVFGAIVTDRAKAGHNDFRVEATAVKKMILETLSAPSWARPDVT